MEELQGVVTEISFRNEESGFTVAKVLAGGAPAASVCVGAMPALEKGESVVVRGSWRLHPRFGRQFSVDGYEIVKPVTLDGIRAMLGSGLITNIGPARARRIIDAFGISTLEVLDTAPQRLLEIPGIGAKIFSQIKDAWERQKSIRELMLFLREAGISVNLATKIHGAYGAAAKQVISANPYALVNDIWGVGFKRADAIAQKMGFQHDSFRRIRAGLVFAVREALGEGHLYLPRAELTAGAVALLGVAEELVVHSLDYLIESKELVDDDGAIYLPASFAAEDAVASMVARRARAADAPGAYTTTYIDKWIASYCIRTGWRGDARQVEAVTAALTHGIMLLTGGPGTGKTTTLQVIVAFLREHNQLAALTAPTGRAAQRMGSISGLRAQTIHRLLEFRPGTHGFSFARNADNPVKADVIIVDEVSMIDIFLMRALLTATAGATRIVLVGDNNQLPSVGPGNVLTDLIAGAGIPHVHLTTIFRQAAASTIVTAAHTIISGVVPSFTNDKDGNCFFIREEEPDACLAAIVDLVSERLPKTYRLDPIADIQVLAPMHRGTLGTQNINRVLQQVLNPGGQRLQRGENVFCRGDKVMQVKNNYDRGVFNGDIGYVAEIIDESALTIDFDGNRIHFDAGNLDEIVPAYCISIHKSQGCEFKAVVIPLVTQHYVMLQRNLLYTALTRARQLCVFVGTQRALSIAVANNEAVRRYSRLSSRIAGRARGADGEHGGG